MPEYCSIFSLVRFTASKVSTICGVTVRLTEASSDSVARWLSGAARSMLMKNADR